MGVRIEDLAAGTLVPVDVAVIDSGIDSSHPDLRGRVVQSYRVTRRDEAVVVEERPTGQNNDSFDHGTAVASIIARIAPNARLIDIGVLEAGNVGTRETLLRGMQLAIERRWRLVNLSLAASKTIAPALFEYCERAYFQNQLIVAARRNMPIGDDGFPAEFASCISVDGGRLASCYDLRYRRDRVIEFAALGMDVPVAAAKGGYTTKTGSSFATPAITGICALLVGAYPELRPFEIKSMLKSLAADREIARAADTVPTP